MASTSLRLPAAFAADRSTSCLAKRFALEVPAEAEIVIEGEISFDRKERGEPFSDYPGYLMVEREFRAVIDVKAITMRRDAIFTAILVGLPPSESNGISRTCREMMLYNHLRYACAMPEVLEVCCPEMGGGWNWWVIRMKKSHPSKPKQALHAAAGMDPTSKMIIVVDEDIDPERSRHGDVGDEFCHAAAPGCRDHDRARAAARSFGPFANARP